MDPRILRHRSHSKTKRTHRSVMGRIVSKDDVWSELQSVVMPYWASSDRSRYVGFADQSYYLPSQEELRSLLEKIAWEPVGFFGEVFDCDDYCFVMKGQASVYARRFMNITAGLCLGIAWARFSWKSDPAHACNWVLVDGQGFAWLEPQRDDPHADVLRQLHSPHECLGELVLLIV